MNGHRRFYAYSLLSYELQHFPLDTIENAYVTTTHAPNHVTREQWGKNNYIFETIDLYLSVHYATLECLQCQNQQQCKFPMRDLDLWRFDLEQLSYMEINVVHSSAKFEDPRSSSSCV